MSWTAPRPQYRRAGLRYTSDLTDGERDILSRFMPERSALGRPRRSISVPSPMLFFTFWAQVASDAPCPKTSRRDQPCNVSSIAGVTT